MSFRFLEEDDHDHEEHEEHEEHGLGLVGIKVIFIFVILLISSASILPLRLKKAQTHENTLSYMNCFAAGMFVSIALIHMLPESVEMFYAWAAHEGIEEPF